MPVIEIAGNRTRFSRNPERVVLLFCPRFEDHRIVGSLSGAFSPTEGSAPATSTAGTSSVPKPSNILHASAVVGLVKVGERGQATFCWVAGNEIRTARSPRSCP